MNQLTQHLDAPLCLAPSVSFPSGVLEEYEWTIWWKSHIIHLKRTKNPLASTETIRVTFRRRYSCILQV